MKQPQYITTTLPYVNAEPHVGFAMEIVRADVLARHHQLLGHDVFFNTGTDEHGQKLLMSAAERNMSVENYVDENAAHYRALLAALGIASDVHFIRTTDSNHIASAQAFWRACDEAGYIYKKHYQAKYCVGCELEKTDSELDNGVCPIHPHLRIEMRDEENYFFKFSAFQDRLLALYDTHTDFVIPDFRLREIRSFVEGGLDDFSISRLKTKMAWGVPVPSDPDHVMYVWFDALVNYISTLGWPDDRETFAKYWEQGAPIQYCGKDNLRQQSAMWQAMLLAAGLPPSRHIIINGFFTGEGGIKMSKSIGNVVNPFALVDRYGKDAFRYFVCAEVSMFEDSPFTLDRFHDAYNGSLANGIGNLTSRILSMATSYDVSFAKADAVFGKPYSEVAEPIADALGRFDLRKAMQTLFSGIKDVDKEISEEKPFTVFKTDPDRARALVANHLEILAQTAVCLQAFMPETAEKIIDALRSHAKPEQPLFERKEPLPL